MPAPIAVAGLGLLGRGIAASLLAHGHSVLAYTRAPEEFATARAVIADAMAQLAAHGAPPAPGWEQRYTEVTALAGLAPAGFLIESIVENFEAKAALFAELETLLGPEVPFASNTSAIPISRMQETLHHPERFFGMHWAEPAYATRFLELIAGVRTAPQVLEQARALALAMGKEPAVVHGDLPGFLANRIGYAMYREALYLLEQGVADAATIDAAFRNSVGLWAAVCGPFRWIDITGGPALYGNAMRGVLPTLSATPELPAAMEQFVARQAAGSANGDGFYAYGPGEADAWWARYHHNVWTVKKEQDAALPLDPA